ncbi:MAG: hypothetical protein MJ116_07000 [Lachnospiraceae bacterium]|nr:hypothetical protein [Lachnospiraceae bacterium]
MDNKELLKTENTDKADEEELLNDEASADGESDQDEDVEESERKILFLKAAQGYGMIFGFGAGYILSGILSELGLQAGKFECVILCMFAGIAIGSILTNKKSGK